MNKLNFPSISSKIIQILPGQFSRQSLADLLEELSVEYLEIAKKSAEEVLEEFLEEFPHEFSEKLLETSPREKKIWNKLRENYWKNSQNNYRNAENLI